MVAIPITCEVCDIAFMMQSKESGSCPGCRTNYAYKEAIVIVLDEDQKAILNKEADEELKEDSV